MSGKFRNGQKLVCHGDKPGEDTQAVYWCPCEYTPGKSWVYFDGGCLGKRDNYVMLVWDHRLEAVG